jgi:hypothetical protein
MPISPYFTKNALNMSFSFPFASRRKSSEHRQELSQRAYTFFYFFPAGVLRKAETQGSI